MLMGRQLWQMPLLCDKLPVYDLISLAVILVVADLRNAFMSMPDWSTWKAHSHENHAPSPWSFSARSSVHRHKLALWLKGFCKILTIVFLSAVRPVDSDLTGQNARFLHFVRPARIPPDINNKYSSLKNASRSLINEYKFLNSPQWI